LKFAALAAVAGAAAAGLAGAAKVLVDRRNEAQEQEGNGVSPQDQPEQQAEAQPEPQGEAEPAAEDAEVESPPSAEDEPEVRDEAEDEPQARDEPEPSVDEDEGGDDDAGSMPQGTSSDEMTEIVDDARRKMQELLGVEPERVSGFDRSNGRWTVTLEVVEVHRVPETTDVLASYEVAFDEDHNLVGMSEVRRYLRSETEGGR
jgi:hypothetical protein